MQRPPLLTIPRALSGGGDEAGALVADEVASPPETPVAKRSRGVTSGASEAAGSSECGSIVASAVARNPNSDGAGDLKCTGCMCATTLSESQQYGKIHSSGGVIHAWRLTGGG